MLNHMGGVVIVTDDLNPGKSVILETGKGNVCTQLDRVHVFDQMRFPIR